MLLCDGAEQQQSSPQSCLAMAFLTSVKEISRAACYRAFQIFCLYSFFFFWKSLRQFWKQKKGTHFWHTALKVEPAVTPEPASCDFCSTVLRWHECWLKSWKGQGKRTYIQGHFSYQSNKNGKRKHNKNVNIFTMFQLYCRSWIKNKGF